MKPWKIRQIMRRRLSRGVTLIEILIVLAIIGLIAGGVAVFAVPQFQKAQIKTTRLSAESLHEAAELWRTTHPGECPTAESLKAEKMLSPSSKLSDAWDAPFKIACDDENTTTVSSSGPDKKDGTQVVIRVHEQVQPK